MKSVREFAAYPPSGITAARSSDAEAVLPFGRSGDPSADTNTVTTKLRSSIRILVIDDDRTLREGCASLLQVEGYNVTVSGRGDEAIEMLRRSQYDIVLCDLCMTPVSGIEILKAALEIRPETIVVMMTGNPSVARCAANSSVPSLTSTASTSVEVVISER